MGNMIILFTTLALILAAEFVNGWTDAPNAIATVVSTRTLSLKGAILLAMIFNMVGVFAFGTAVAETVGKKLINSHGISILVISAAASSIIVWSTIAWCFGIPTSESHGLLAGLSGAAVGSALYGSFTEWWPLLKQGEFMLGLTVIKATATAALVWEGWLKALIGLAIAPPLAMVFSYFVAGMIQRRCRTEAVKFKKIFRWLQTLSATIMSIAHGANDGQKFMGLIGLMLFISGTSKEFVIPAWAVVLCALTMGLGTSLGGGRIIKKMGFEMLRRPPQPYQGFAAEAVSDATILLSTAVAIPLSTTVTSTFGMIGAGRAENERAIRWNVVIGMFHAWIITFPLCGGIALVSTFLMRIIFN